MKGVVRVVCRPGIRDGFALAGVRAIAAGEAREAAAALAGLVEREDTGVVLVEGALWDGLPDEFRRGLERRASPVVVPFPGPESSEGRPAAEADLVELLRGAIGYRVRLR